MKKCRSYRCGSTHACSAVQVYDLSIFQKIVEQHNAIPQFAPQVSRIKINHWSVMESKTSFTGGSSAVFEPIHYLLLGLQAKNCGDFQRLQLFEISLIIRSWADE